MLALHGLGLFQATLAAERERQVGQHRGPVRMVVAGQPLDDRQRRARVALGLGHPAGGALQRGQVVQFVHRLVGAVGAHLGVDRNGLLEGHDPGFHLADVLQHDAQVVQGDG